MKLLLIIIGISIVGGLLAKIIYGPEDSLGAIVALLVFISIISFYRKYEKKRQDTFAEENVKGGKAQLSSDWYIAVTHFLTTNIIYFVPALIVSIIARTVVAELWQSIILFLVLNIPAFAFATRYSSKYINKNYVVNTRKKQKIIRLGILYYLVVHTLFMFYATSQNSVYPNTLLSILNLTEIIVLFYLVSNKFIVTDE